jgi:hypothetical protein
MASAALFLEMTRAPVIVEKVKFEDLIIKGNLSQAYSGRNIVGEEVFVMEKSCFVRSTD